MLLYMRQNYQGLKKDQQYRIVEENDDWILVLHKGKPIYVPHSCTQPCLLKPRYHNLLKNGFEKDLLG